MTHETSRPLNNGQPPSNPSEAHLANTEAPAPPQQVRWKLVGIFCAVALLIMSIAAAPFWLLTAGIQHPAYTWVIGTVGMFAPLIASVVVARVAGEKWAHVTGLQFRGRWGRIILWSVLGSFIPFFIALAASVIMVLRGVPGDLTGKTWASLSQQQFASAGLEVSIPVVILLVLGGSVINLLATTISTFGEEVGWRGWLWRELKPLGFTVAITIGGLIWALWHLPIVLIGHNYPGMPRPFAIGMFIAFCIALNLLLGAITERSGGNPIPASFAHAAVNSSAMLALGLVATQATNEHLSWYIDTIMGASGIVLITIVGILLFPRRAKATFGQNRK